MEKLGILIDKPDRSQKFFALTKELNKIKNIDCIVFYIENGQILTPTNFALMEAIYASQFDGTLISTDITTTKILKNNFDAKKKFFYVWDFEWLRNPNTFSENNEIYNGDIELIARSQVHYDLLNRVWKKPKEIIEEFNYEKLIKL